MPLVIVGLSGLTVEATPDPRCGNAIGFSMLVLFVIALMEEVAFRSYPLVRLCELFGPRMSIYCTSLFFALYHGLDPANLLGPGVWGIVFGLAAIASRGIALPLGIHFGLNWMQSVFGMKAQFATSRWTIMPGPNDRIVSPESIALVLQVSLLAIAILLVELFVRKNPEPAKLVNDRFPARPVYAADEGALEPSALSLCRQRVQQHHHLELSSLAGHVQRSQAFLVYQCPVCAELQEHAASFHGAILGCMVQRSEAGQIGEIDRGALRDQEPDNHGVIVPGGPVQRAPTIATAMGVERVDQSPGGERCGYGRRVPLL